MLIQNMSSLILFEILFDSFILIEHDNLSCPNHIRIYVAYVLDIAFNTVFNTFLIGAITLHNNLFII